MKQKRVKKTKKAKKKKLSADVQECISKEIDEITDDIVNKAVDTCMVKNTNTQEDVK